jgi:hypothetical protein
VINMKLLATKPEFNSSYIWPSIMFLLSWLKWSLLHLTAGFQISNLIEFYVFPLDLTNLISKCTNSLMMPLSTKTTLDRDTFYEAISPYTGSCA